MSWWWIGIVGLVVAMFGVARAGRGRAASPVAEELFEGLIPWAATGGARAARSGPGWGARWTEDLSSRPARGLPLPTPPGTVSDREADVAPAATPRAGDVANPQRDDAPEPEREYAAAGYAASPGAIDP